MHGYYDFKCIELSFLKEGENTKDTQVYHFVSMSQMVHIKHLLFLSLHIYDSPLEEKKKILFMAYLPGGMIVLTEISSYLT